MYKFVGTYAQYSEVRVHFTQVCPTLCDSIDHNTPDFPLHRQLP